MTATLTPRPQPTPEQQCQLLIGESARARPDPSLVPPGQKYVVACTLIGPKIVTDPADPSKAAVLPERREGDVCGAEELGGPDEVLRLLCRARPFVREATAFEATQARVSVGQKKTDPVVEELLAAERLRLLALQAQMDQKDAQIGRLNGLLSRPPEMNPAAAREAMEGKDRAIADLQGRLLAMQEQMADMAKRLEGAAPRPPATGVVTAESRHDKGRR